MIFTRAFVRPILVSSESGKWRKLIDHLFTEICNVFLPFRSRDNFLCSTWTTIARSLHFYLKWYNNDLCIEISLIIAYIDGRRFGHFRRNICFFFPKLATRAQPICAYHAIHRLCTIKCSYVDRKMVGREQLNNDDSRILVDSHNDGRGWRGRCNSIKMRET